MGAPKRSPERKRLAKFMDERRSDLRFRWDDVAERADLSYETLRQVRFGTGDVRSLTKRGIEEALHWKRGSIDAILAGGEPTDTNAQSDGEHGEQSAPPAEPTPEEIRAMTDDELDAYMDHALGRASEAWAERRRRAG